MPAPLPFGRYLLLDRIAIGGMAELFLAKAVGDGGFDKVCVIKRVLPHLALDHAHQMRGPDGKPLGIVHRDVSPANLFVTYRGQVKLLDFGIAHAEARLAQT